VVRSLLNPCRDKRDSVPVDHALLGCFGGSNRVLSEFSVYGTFGLWRFKCDLRERKAMNTANPIGVTGLRAEGYSPDGKSLIISLTLKYSNAERKYSVPVDCFDDLILDLRRLNSSPTEAVSTENHIQQADALEAAE
jgi:hypothetical protein